MERLSSPSNRLAFYIATVLDAATVNLHRVFCGSVPNSRRACVEAAQDMFVLSAQTIYDMHVVHPAVGVRFIQLNLLLSAYAHLQFMWASACQVLVMELGHLQEGVTDGWIRQNKERDVIREKVTMRALRHGMHVLELYAKDSLLFGKCVYSLCWAILTCRYVRSIGNYLAMLLSTRDAADEI
jgi:hypothetical protein